MRIPKTPICVDEFKFIPGVYIYLLTHLHSDHTSGLTPSWNHGKIFCTKITKEMLLHKFNINPSLVIALDLQKTYTIDLDKDSKNQMDLTLYDSNHCIGGAMYLMEGYFGTILHTGDFRFDNYILDFFKGKDIDTLYLDDTFCDKIYDFPPRKEAGEQIISIIKEYSDEHKILIASDTLGKEELFTNIAHEFQTLIVVPQERLAMIKCIQRVVDLPDVFTQDPEKGRVHVVSKKELTWSRIQNERKERPTIGIVPSGWAEAYKTNSNKRVPYSLHSSYKELELFVKTIKPKNLYSVSKKDNVDLFKSFSHLLSTKPMKDFEIPKSVEVSMEEKKSKLKKKSVKKVVVQKKKKDCIDLTEEENLDESLLDLLENIDKPTPVKKKQKFISTSDLLNMSLDFE